MISHVLWAGRSAFRLKQPADQATQRAIIPENTRKFVAIACVWGHVFSSCSTAQRRGPARGLWDPGVRPWQAIQRPSKWLACDKRNLQRRRKLVQCGAFEVENVNSLPAGFTFKNPPTFLLSKPQASHVEGSFHQVSAACSKGMLKDSWRMASSVSILPCDFLCA